MMFSTIILAAGKGTRMKSEHFRRWVGERKHVSLV
jgi:bifunctional N-acetylglucosamine-1-phosphate-uridyltransferase/glucosamine-1-phosphate-acetyltransferase GlmU-like protein